MVQMMLVIGLIAGALPFPHCHQVTNQPTSIVGEHYSEFQTTRATMPTNYEHNCHDYLQIPISDF